MNLVDKDDILKDISDLQKSPWYNDGHGAPSNERYFVRKEAVEIVRDLYVKVAPIVEAIPIEWLEQRFAEADKAVFYCKGDARKNVDVSRAIQTVLELWEEREDALN